VLSEKILEWNNLLDVLASPHGALLKGLWVVVGMFIAWWGPASELTRNGTHLVYDMLFRRTLPAVLVGMVALAWAAALFIWLASAFGWIGK
jgi:hypothetical protein